MKNIQILSVPEKDLAEIQTYVIEVRKQLFPTLNHDIIPKDIAAFRKTYLESATGAFLQARNSRDELIGVIGMMPYDHRFPQLNYPFLNVVEVARLFVDPAYRRSGLATMLVDHLKVKAKEKQVHVMYLHTHPFLKGAYEFWLKQGFKLEEICMEGGFETIHMSLNLKKKQSRSL